MGREGRRRARSSSSGKPETAQRESGESCWAEPGADATSPRNNRHTIRLYTRRASAPWRPRQGLRLPPPAGSFGAHGAARDGRTPERLELWGGMAQLDDRTQLTSPGVRDLHELTLIHADHAAVDEERQEARGEARVRARRPALSETAYLVLAPVEQDARHLKSHIELRMMA